MLWDTRSDPETSDLVSTESAHVHFRVPRLTFNSADTGIQGQPKKPLPPCSARPCPSDGVRLPEDARVVTSVVSRYKF
ncbi:hypothetical protein CesoFtcFv8_010760 [Champsocephalus esox]|nr:hypothetical protein CesoFtcFv8_010760 [Champsocephalus esox]